MGALLSECGYDLSYNSSTGDHTWFYWDREIQKAIDFMLSK